MIGVLVVSLLVVTLGATAVATAPSQSVPLVDPEVRTRADAGRVRVLLELRVDEPPGSPARAQAIARAQDAVLSRVSAPHALLVRRYTSVPMLALEIDATGLRALAEMTDIVVAVKPDRTVRTQ